MKRFKTKKQINYKNKWLLVIFIILFLCFFIWISLVKLNNSHSSLMNLLLKNTRFNQTKTSLFQSIPRNLNFLLKTSSFYEKNAIVYGDNIPKIYLYNTHDTEEYFDKKKVTDASKALESNLKKLGINTLVEERHPSDFLHTGIGYYDISKNFINGVKDKYPNINYFIDIHRDSVVNTTVIINNKKYAKILFVLGLDNNNYQNNKIILEKMNKYLNDNYPGISKGILEKKGKDVNGVYNQDIGENVLLIELGGIENNIDEVYNSTEIIALMLYHMLGDKNEKGS